MFGVYDYWLFGLFATFAAFDILAPARAFPAVRGWRVKGDLLIGRDVAGGERGLVAEVVR